MKELKVMRKESNNNPDSLVLIVDHYKIGQRVALLQLNHFGLSAHVVTSCRQAIHALRKNHYTLVMIGSGMPNCDGSATIKFVRRLELRRNKKTTVVAVTSHALQGAKERCVASGMDDLICKPITMTDMQQLLKRHLQIA